MLESIDRFGFCRFPLSHPLVLVLSDIPTSTGGMHAQPRPSRATQCCLSVSGTEVFPPVMGRQIFGGSYRSPENAVRTTHPRICILSPVCSLQMTEQGKIKYYIRTSLFSVNYMALPTPLHLSETLTSNIITHRHSRLADLRTVP